MFLFFAFVLIDGRLLCSKVFERGCVMLLCDHSCSFVLSEERALCLFPLL